MMLKIRRFVLYFRNCNIQIRESPVMKYADLTAVAADLAVAPPAFTVDPERETALRRLDSLLGEADSENSPRLGRFYRERVDRALAEIAAYRGKTPRFWKLYSSGFVVKSARRTLAVDINGGCTPGRGRTRITLRDDQIRKLAELIDEYYCTHSHEDHISAPLCDALARRRKLIVMPAESIHRWLISGATAAEELLCDHCRVFLNWQGNASGGLDCAMYLFTLENGRTVMVRGDIYHGEGFDACMEHLRAWNLPVDYVFTSPYYTSGDDPIAALGREFACRFVPIHEWEFSHRALGKPGPATQCFAELYEKFDVWYQCGRAQFLTWGESISLD